MVLSRRRGSTLSRRSILKSHRPDTSRPKALDVEGVLDLRQARGLPIFTLGQCTVQVSGQRCVFCGHMSCVVLFLFL